jgi:hypothetical protein
MLPEKNVSKFPTVLRPFGNKRNPTLSAAQRQTGAASEGASVFSIPSDPDRLSLPLDATGCRGVLRESRAQTAEGRLDVASPLMRRGGYTVWRERGW